MAEKAGVLAVLNYFRSTRLSKGLGWFLSLLIDLIIIALIIWLMAGRGGDVKSAADASMESTAMEAPATTVNDNEAAV